jgi:hypothetical protein
MGPLLALNTVRWVVYYFARCSSYLLRSRVWGQSKRLLGPLGGRCAFSPAPGCSPHKRYASFTPGLAARLVDTCLHELPRLLRPYALKLLKPRGSMARRPAQPRAAPAPRWAIPRRFGPLALELRYTACLPLSPLVRLAHWLLGGKRQQIHPRTLEGRTLQADSSE